MISLIKFLKIVLPIATVTTATIATVSLVSFKKVDLDQNRDNEDKVLDDFELKTKDFKEKKMLYSKDGKNDSVTLEDDTLAEEILKKFQNGENLREFEGKVPDIDKIKKYLSESKDILSDKLSAVDSERNNGDAGLPNQLPSQQSILPESISDAALGMQSDKSRQDDLDVKSKPDASKHLDKGDENDSKEQHDKGSELTDENIGLKNSQVVSELQDQEEESEKQTRSDSDTVDSSQSSTEQKPQIEDNGQNTGQESDLRKTTEPESKDSVTQKPVEDGLTLSNQVVSETIGSNEISDGRENSTDIRTSFDGGQQLSLKEIQELEALEKEMADLKDSLQQLSR